jgi:hypothetical protein
MRSRAGKKIAKFPSEPHHHWLSRPYLRGKGCRRSLGVPAVERAFFIPQQEEGIPMAVLETAGAFVVAYWAGSGIVRGALQFGQGVALAAGCIANGDPKAALACMAGGVAAPIVGVMNEIEQTADVAMMAARVIGSSVAKKALLGEGAGGDGANHQAAFATR